ncbi:hypothetical protein LWI28_023818 [Acer negundo]|uniref:RNase H type-1 domain-containing protein n=1 Tax=Acer negundo TaxID=4023 RepID=A0AAD5IFY4_ACENE|nr:hypothetical protein LWI28_023818 [Acer negundo]
MNCKAMVNMGDSRIGFGIAIRDSSGFLLASCSQTVEATYGAQVAEAVTILRGLIFGRKICPGIPLAEKMLLYVVSTFLHSFEWNLPHGTTLDLSEKFGLVMKMQEPLIAIPIAKYSSPEHYL